MNVKTLLETNGYTVADYSILSDTILALDFGEDVAVEKYGDSKFDLFDGVRLVCTDCEVVLNFEDNEFTQMAIFYLDDVDGFHEYGFSEDGVCLYVSYGGDVVSF